MNVVKANEERDVFLVNEDQTGKRIIFIPRNWVYEMGHDDPDDGTCINCWYGNADVLAFEKRETKEWLTTDAQAYFALFELENMSEVSEEEARQIDPDLFRLLDYVNSGY